MADVQLENGYIRIATELLDEIIRRDFSKRQLAILHFIIRLSYGCQKKDCNIEKFNFFELTGLNKSDIKKELQFLKDCRVINWDESTMIFSINKDYERWQINPSKGFNKEKLDLLIHENLKTKVGKIPTNQKSEVSKIPTKLDEKVSKIPTMELVKHQHEEPSTPCESKGEEVSKDSIKDSYLKINTTTTTENPIVLFEKSICRLSPFQSDSLLQWVDDFGGKPEIVNEAITIADNKNKRYYGFVEFLLKEWANNNLNDLERIRVYEQEKFNKYKIARGAYNKKPIRQEKLPVWFEEEQKKRTESPANESKMGQEEKRKEIQELLSSFQTK